MGVGIKKQIDPRAKSTHRHDFVEDLKVMLHAKYINFLKGFCFSLF
jgi:hypothetical protein